MTNAYVVILMGSKADLEHCQKIAEAVNRFGINAVLRIGSAHKTPEHIMELLNHYEADRIPKVYITVAGRSNALSGFTDASVSAPVIACPPPSESFGGADIYSSLRMPSGVAPGVVLEPVNAALLAAKILGLVNPEIQARVVSYQKQMSDKVIESDASLKTQE